MSERSTIEYQPALDGVRALAVAAVLLFHAEVPGFGGGYLGVSVFFTLSGYLITALLLAEHDRRGRIDLANFYARRLRRLLPASGLCLLAIVIIAALTDVFTGVDTLRREVLGAVLQVANWVFLAGEGSYQEIFQQTGGARSPIEHFWSLAIEEQFYWIWPPTMVVVLRVARSARSRVIAVTAITIAFAAAAPLTAATWGADAAYWATPARIAEILVGATLAVVCDSRGTPARVAALAPIALAVLAACVVMFPPTSGPAYQGWLPAVAVASGALVLGLQADGPVRRVLATPPLVGLGRISYGVYLYHWPVYVIADEHRTGLDRPLLVPLQIAVTLCLSVVSYRLVERPIRTASRWPKLPTIAAGAVTTAAVATAAVVVLPGALGDYYLPGADAVEAAAIEVGDGDEQLVAVATTTPVAPSLPTVPDVGGPTTPPTATTPPGPTTPPAPPPLPELSRPVRIVVTGDSTAAALGAGVVGWAAANPELAQAEISVARGCGFMRGGERRRGDGVESDAACDGWVESQLLPTVQRAEPDVVAVMVTTWDLIGRRWTTEELLSPTDPEFHERLSDAYATLVDQLRFVGATRIVFIREPVPDVWWLPAVQEEDEPERHQVMYDIYAALEADHPDLVEVVALDEWFTDQGFDRDKAVRPDGVHLDTPFAEQIVTDFLGEQLIRAALGMETS